MYGVSRMLLSGKLINPNNVIQNIRRITLKIVSVKAAHHTGYYYIKILTSEEEESSDEIASICIRSTFTGTITIETTLKIRILEGVLYSPIDIVFESDNPETMYGTTISAKMHMVAEDPDRARPGNGGHIVKVTREGRPISLLEGIAWKAKNQVGTYFGNIIDSESYIKKFEERLNPRYEYPLNINMKDVILQLYLLDDDQTTSSVCSILKSIDQGLPISDTSKGLLKDLESMIVNNPSYRFWTNAE